MVLLAAAQAEVPVREATPNEVKVAVTGHGRAEKDQVGRMVAVCLGLAAPPKPDDTSDALAVAIWAANAERPGRRAPVGRAGSRVRGPDASDSGGNGQRERGDARATLARGQGGPRAARTRASGR